MRGSANFASVTLPAGAASMFPGLGRIDTAGAFLIDRLVRASGR